MILTGCGVILGLITLLFGLGIAGFGHGWGEPARVSLLAPVLWALAAWQFHRILIAQLYPIRTVLILILLYAAAADCQLYYSYFYGEVVRYHVTVFLDEGTITWWLLWLGWQVLAAIILLMRFWSRPSE